MVLSFKPILLAGAAVAVAGLISTEARAGKVCATDIGGVVIAGGAVATNPSDLACGDDTTEATGDGALKNATAVGASAKAINAGTTALGSSAFVNGLNGTGVGQAVQATGDNFAGVGQAAEATGENSAAFGQERRQQIRTRRRLANHPWPTRKVQWRSGLQVQRQEGISRPQWEISPKPTGSIRPRWGQARLPARRRQPR